MNPRFTFPVLNYHHVHNGPDPSFRVTPNELQAQLQWLLDVGYIPIDLTQMIQREERLESQKRFVLVTFDDGYENFLIHAWPILQALKISCTLFIISDYLGGWNDWDDLKQSRHRHLSLDQLCELQQTGVCIGSHSRSHPVLLKLRKEDLVSELRDSQRALETSLGLPIRAFAYPGGHVDRRVCQVTARYYELGFSTNHSAGAISGDAYRIPRFDPSFCRDLTDFERQFNLYNASR